MFINTKFGGRLMYMMYDNEIRRFDTIYIYIYIYYETTPLHRGRQPPVARLTSY